MVHDPLVTREQMSIYQAVWKRGALTVCSCILLTPALGPETVEERIVQIARFAVCSGFGDDLLKIWELKFGLDGGAEGGSLEQPYVNNPKFHGHLLWTPAELFQVANFAVRQRWRIGTLVVGDRATWLCLVLFAHVEKRLTS